MTPFTCSFCGTPSATGAMYDSIHLLICRSCRDIALTWLKANGIALITDHPFVRELAVDSHRVESGCWHYYDSVTQQREQIIRGNAVMRESKSKMKNTC